MAIEKKKLNFKEYNEILSIMRRWVDSYRKYAAKLIFHITYQAEEIRKLEEEVRYLKQQKFFEDKKNIEVKIAEPPKPKAPPPEKWPLNRRLWEMVRKDAIGGEEWELTLRHANLTEEAAIALARTYFSPSVDK